MQRSPIPAFGDLRIRLLRLSQCVTLSQRDDIQ